MNGLRRFLPAARIAHLIGWSLILNASVDAIAAEPPIQAESATSPPPENPLTAERELFRPDQLIVKLDRDRVEPLDLEDGSALSAVLLRYGAVGHRQAFVGYNKGHSRVTTANQSAQRAKRRFPTRAARRAEQPIEVPDLEKILLVQLEHPTDVLQAVTELLAQPGVEYAEPNLLFHTMASPLPNEAFLPNDRYISDDGVHWSEGAWGQAYFDLWGVEKLRAIEAWNQFDLDGSGVFESTETKPGENVVVAIIDSGLDSSHPDIAGNLWRNDAEIPDNQIDDDGNGLVDDLRGWDFVENDADPEDRFGHGTHVAGTVAARGNNEIGVVGIAPWALIMPLKGLSDLGSGNAIDLANAVRYAADMGADVISASWGGLGPSATLEAAFIYARDLGVISVAAAGNSDADVAHISPANFDTVLAVAATDPDDVRAAFSNHGSLIDLAAPGVGILSLNANTGDNVIAEAFPERVVGGDYIYLRGTSMACPHASGAVAVLLSQDPGASMVDIRGRLLAGAASIADLNPGFETALGWGRVDLLASLSAEPRPLLEVIAIDPGGAAPGKNASIAVHVKNLWAAGSGVTATLSTDSSYAIVSEQDTAFGDILPDQVVDNIGDPFEVMIDASIPIGHDIPFDLTLKGDDGYSQLLHLSIQIRHFEVVSRKVGLPLFDFIPWNVTLHDYDGDGDADAQWIGLATDNSLYRNTGESFTEAGGAAGVGASHGLFLDIDNDGDQDRLLAGFTDFNASKLLLNTGAGAYSDITDASGIRGLRAFTAAALDYDGDGWVDFLASSHPDPRARRPESLFLMRNNGDGTFTDVAPQTCIDLQSSLGLGQMLVFDYDNDADSDLLFASTEDVSLYRNNGDGTFSDVAAKAGLTPSRRSKRSCDRHAPRSRRPGCPQIVAMGGAVGDYDNDGDLDVFLTGRSAATDGSSSLYRNDGSGSFTDVTADSGDFAAGKVSGLFWGNDFFDYDNDGDLDLYVTSEGITEITINTLYQNDGAGKFSRVTDLAFPSDTGPSGAAAAIGDYNNDGALDIYAPAGALGSGGLGAFYENQTGQRNHWIVVRLRGTLSHRDAFGARVTITADGRTQLRELHTSPVDPQPLHFGLGEATSVDEVRVRWPSGIVQILRDAPADQVLVISEPAACDADSEEIAACPTTRQFPREQRSANSSNKTICNP